jgi:hypothetical protein
MMKRCNCKLLYHAQYQKLKEWRTQPVDQESGQLAAETQDKRFSFRKLNTEMRFKSGSSHNVGNSTMCKETGVCCEHKQAGKSKTVPRSAGKANQSVKGI